MNFKTFLFLLIPFLSYGQFFSFDNGTEMNLSSGLALIEGDNNSKLTESYFVDLKFTKPLNHIFSAQLGANYSKAHGISTLPLYNLEALYPLNYQGYDGAHYVSYKSSILSLNFDVQIELSNLIVDKTNKWNVYLASGIGLTNHQVYLDNLDENGVNYSIQETLDSDPDLYNPDLQRGRNEIKQLLTDQYDRVYETPGPKEYGKFRFGDETNISPNLSFTIGVKRRISKRIMFGVEIKSYFIQSDLLDGVANQSISKNTSYDKLYNVGISLSTPIGKKTPQSWENHLAKMEMQNDSLKMALESHLNSMNDEDNDGVVNKFDKNNNTPKDCPVDKNGELLDSDDDGIADCFDKSPYWNEKLMNDLLTTYNNSNTNSKNDSSSFEDLKNRLEFLEQSILSTSLKTSNQQKLCYIFFEKSSHTISPQELKKLVSFLANIGNIGQHSTLILYGSSSISGDQELNVQLAKNRINAAKSILEQFFLVPKESISYKNLGEGKIENVNYEFLDQLVIIEYSEIQ